MDDIKRETGHLNISDTALRRMKILPKAIKLRKKLGYNHDDIMICEETSIAEKIIKLFPKKILCLITNLITENQIFGLKLIILLLKLMNEIMKIMIQMMKKKKRENMFKNYNFRFF